MEYVNVYQPIQLTHNYYETDKNYSWQYITMRFINNSWKVIEKITLWIMT